VLIDRRDPPQHWPPYYVCTAKKRETTVCFYGESSTRLDFFGINLPLVTILKALVVA
jgi:hypothetical protein